MDRTSLHALLPDHRLAPGTVLHAHRDCGVFRLEPRAPVRLLCPVAARLEVLDGRLWLTRVHDPDDHFPQAGATLALDAGADVLLEADRGRSAWVALHRLDAAARP